MSLTILWPRSSTTAIRDVKAKIFLVTHPYHPLYDRQFDLVNYTFCWGVARVYYYSDQNRLRSMPAAWTSVGQIDPFVQVSAGRSPFRLVDLLELSRMVNAIKCNANNVHT